jgi:hypothetical protein
MFDLEYYNEITDYGKFMYNHGKTKLRNEGIKPIIKYTDYKNYNLDIDNKCYTFAYNLIMYEKIIGAGYMLWYDNYYNKLPIII